VNTPAAVVILLALLIGPLILHPIERNFEPYCFLVGVVAVSFGRQWSAALIAHAAAEPLMITAAVIVAGLVFGRIRDRLDRTFVRMRRRLSRFTLTAAAVFAIAILASVITAIVAALLLVEAVRLMRFDPVKRTTVTVIGCFAIGMGAALTPIGEPLATLVASGLHLGFTGLFRLLLPLVLPGIAVLSLAAGWRARGAYEISTSTAAETPESSLGAIIQGLKVYLFVAGLALVSKAFEPLADHYVPMLGTGSLYWINLLSAALDNATLVAVEMHHMPLGRAREVLMSLLIAGGMLIPGNIPNIVSAGVLRIASIDWARRGVPVGFALLGIYFAVLLCWNQL
jgi:predicted cation transporter